MRALVVGPFAKTATLRTSKATLVCAVDAGMGPCLRAKSRVDIAVGDWDSFSLSRVRAKKTVILAKDKNMSDARAALGHIFAAGFRDIEMVGFRGGRFDHELALYLDVAQLLIEVPRGAVKIDEFVMMWGALCSPIRLSSKKGRIISIFDISGRVRHLRLEGFRYSGPLERFKWGSHGLSNRIDSTRASISYKSGPILMVLND